MPRSLLRKPAVPRVRPAALGSTYVVSRDRRNGVVIVRKTAAGDGAELASSRRRLGVVWPAVAQAILDDALDARPPRKLIDDYSHFIVTARGGVRAIAGNEIQQWLDTWRPGLSALLTSAR